MAFKTSEKYKSVIYSGDCRHKLKLLFNGVELADADVYCESLKVTSRILPNGSTRFSLDNFISKEAELILHDIDTTIIQSPVNISIGTLVDGTYEYVPIGLFVVQDLPTTDKNKTTIKLRDYAVKFDFGYNAKDIIDENGGSATKLQILQDICNKAGVETDITKFYGSNSKIGIYDNTITGRTYISYLAEQAGSIATIDRSGKLIFVQLKDLETVEIPLNIVEKYEDGEKYEISRVVYEDAIRKFEYGDESKDTLFINTANPYIENNVLTDIALGSKIEISDSSDNPVVSYKQYGYTKQNVYRGKNKFNVEDITVSNLTTIIDKNTSSFKYVNHWASELMSDTKLKELLEPSTDYIVSAKVTLISKPDASELTGGNHGNIMILYKAGETTKAMLATTLDIKNNWKVGETKELSTTLTTPADLTGWKILTYTYLTANYGVGEFQIDYMMIRKKDENDTFEPYVGGKASPSPEYPQEIEVGRGKNLAIKNVKGYPQTSNSTIRIDNASESFIFYAVQGQQYTFNSVEPTNRSIICKINTDNPETGTPYTNYETIEKTFTSSFTGYAFLYVNSTLNDNIKNTFIINKGPKATSYLPYNTIESKSTGKNLLGLIDGTYTNNGITAVVENGKITINGTATATSFISLPVQSEMTFLNQTYTMSVNNVSVISDSLTEFRLYTSGSPYKSVTFTSINNKVTLSDDNTYTMCQLRTASGVTYNSFVIYPQVELGSSATVFEPYKESSIQYNLGDNFIADKDYIQDGVLNKNVGKVVIDTSKIEFVDTYTNVAYAKIPKPDDFIGKGDFLYHKLLCTCASSKYINSWDLVDNVNVISAQASTNNIFIGFAKGTTLEQMKTYLTGAEIYYELATPEQIPLETTGELRTFEPNTIITNDLDSEMEVEYSLNQTQVSQILELNKNIPLNSFKTGKIIGNPAIDAYDIIKIIDGDKEFKTLATNDLTYNGVMINTFDTQIGKEAKKENVTLTPEATFKKWAKTEIDNVEAEVRINTGKIETVADEIGNMYTKGQVNELIANAETGVTNTFSEAGGNNVFRNTGLWFKNTGEDSETNPYEFWVGKANEGSNDKATNYRSILLGNGSFIQDDIEVPNGNYSISFYYRKLITNAIASVVINDKEYTLDSLETKQFYTGEQNNETGEYIVDPIVVSNNHIKIEFKCDALDGVEVYDLMCNKGSVKLAYSQNQNETTTDTVNISRGITITSSKDKNTKFKADYDGIRILDGNNNPKTTFTDKGTETDELLVRKKATIVGLLHQEVDDQTWVTKI